MRILLLLVACMGFSCAHHENPLALTSPPAGKANVHSGKSEYLAIFWPCDAEVNSVWTVFYGSDYRLQAHGDSVLFSHYLDSNSKTQYWASETSTRLGRVRSGFRSGDGMCGIWSEAFDHDSSVVRIYKGDVDYLYRDTPDARYALSESDVQYPIAFVQAEGAVRHRDFLSVQNRNDPRPADLVEIGDNPTKAYYLPVNFSAAATDTLIDLPEDDRPYLDGSYLDDSIKEERVVSEVSTTKNNAASQAAATTTATVTTTVTVIEPEPEPEPATQAATVTEDVRFSHWTFSAGGRSGSLAFSLAPADAVDVIWLRVIPSSAGDLHCDSITDDGASRAYTFSCTDGYTGSGSVSITVNEDLERSGSFDCN